MSFTYIPARKVSDEESSPWNNLLTNALKNYETVTKSKYLEPTLQEALLKSRQYNEMYKPNIQSQIGLRGAQAGHLGAQTEGLNISNPYLSRQLQQEQEKRQFELNNPFAGKSGTQGLIAALDFYRKLQNPNMEDSAQNDNTKIENPNSESSIEDQRHADNQRLQAQMDAMEQQQQKTNEKINPITNPNAKKNIPANENEFNPVKLLEQALINSVKTKNVRGFSPPTSVKEAQALKDVRDNKVPFTDRTQEFEDEAQRAAYEKDLTRSINAKLNQQTSEAEKQKDRIELERIKREEKQILENSKSDIHEQKIQRKLIADNKKDLPKLYEAKKSLQSLINIASDPKNDELFGHHGILGFGGQGAEERFLKTTHNPKAGEWQTHIATPIQLLEQGFSSKGNQLALKTALSMKANFQESRAVALEKLKASLNKTNEIIKNSEKIIGHEKKSENNYKPNTKVKVEMPDGTIKIMTHAEAKKIGAE